ncbi:hypothetical protein [Caballeronia novacaledonica]|uniref:Uncharacterized protein n=1 Tax=Caballeronia novacaledonica TaxID=1544861 RepID=A0AA37IIG4_9BURK|nr:hypothetical protein [Caballeronia novacaledonica]GJH29933.1 hypothetical protein CBA19CS42_35475 [Caballeronia novacaledonica]
MLAIPQHIERSGVRNQPVGYTWRGDADYNRESRALSEKLHAMSRRASLACAASMTQWGVARLQHLSDFQAPQQMIEAAWAANVHPLYCKIPAVYEFNERKGPVDGVLRIFKDLLEDVIRRYDTPNGMNVPGGTVYVYFLARHVMPDKKPFDKWLKWAIERMIALYPFSRDDPIGEPIPHEALDPDFDFRKEEAPELLNEFMRGLDPSTNHYLRTPDEMVADGFQGTPYSV